MANERPNNTQSPLLTKYHKMLEDDPRSRVFAPLAESYRKLGMLDRALEILKRGISLHPSYTLGYLGIAFCYYDLEQFDLAYTTLRPLIENNRDNLRLQKLFAKTCHQIGNDEEALETFKYLLFINPKDGEAAEYVSKLESEKNLVEEPIVFEKKEKLEDRNEAFAVDSLSVNPDSDDLSFDDWVQVDLPEQPEESEKKVVESRDEVPNDSIEDWNLAKPQEKPIIVDLEPENKASLEEVEDISAPVITHTLVDLYCAQGHAQKAMEILKNILALNPDDKKTLRKMEEVKKLMLETKVEESPEALKSIEEDPLKEEVVENAVETPGEGHEKLMNLYDSKLNSINDDAPQAQLEDKLWLFYNKIQQRAKEVRSFEK